MPLTWSAGQGVVWKVPLQAWSNASPVLGGDRLFVCEEPSTLVCVARATGEVLWRVSNEQGDLVPGGSPSPADAAVRLRALQAQERELRARERGGVMATASRPDDAAAAQDLAEVRGRLAATRKEIQELQAAVPARPPTHATNGYSSPTPLWDRAEQAWALIQGQSVPGVGAGDKKATGLWTAAVPDILLNRVDPKGDMTRAAIADLGSMIIHDRSGAAVTASEYPRLRPFIPLATDKPDVARNKLARFVSEYRAIQQEMMDFYKQSGYNVPESVTRENRGATGGWSIERVE